MVTNESVNGMRWSMIDLGYHEVLGMKPDPRMEDWLLMTSIWPTVYISTAYVILAKWIGPWLMKGREPFEFRQVLILYNGLQVIFSAWLFSMIVGFWFGEYSYTCQPVDYSYSKKAVTVASVCWWYYISKFTEFFDTLFFVLRKKNRHISFLHVFHHGIMPVGTWFVIRYAPGGHTTFPGMLNTFVHVIMYFYYMVAAMGPGYEKWIWWKKYVTKMQLVQFVLAATHSAQLFFIECNYPRFFALLYFINANFFIFLFSNFYGQSYKKKPNLVTSTKSVNGGGNPVLGDNSINNKLKSG